jgi:hypothetical protein
VLIDTYEQVVCSAAFIHRRQHVAIDGGRAITRSQYEQRGIEIVSGQVETQVIAESAQRTSRQEGFVGLACTVGSGDAGNT